MVEAWRLYVVAVRVQCVDGMYLTEVIVPIKEVRIRS